jgi:hypothetical protein
MSDTEVNGITLVLVALNRFASFFTVLRKESLNRKYHIFLPILEESGARIVRGWRWCNNTCELYARERMRTQRELFEQPSKPLSVHTFLERGSIAGVFIEWSGLDKGAARFDETSEGLLRGADQLLGQLHDHVQMFDLFLALIQMLYRYAGGWVWVGVFVFVFVLFF